MIAEEETQNVSHLYNDEVDFLIDEIIRLQQAGRIDESVVRLLFSNILLNMAQESVTNITTELMLKNKPFLRSNNVNKFVFLNYSKESYA